jgi:hypothetical protein
VTEINTGTSNINAAVKLFSARRHSCILLQENMVGMSASNKKPGTNYVLHRAKLEDNT